MSLSSGGDGVPLVSGERRRPVERDLFGRGAGDLDPARPVAVRAALSFTQDCSGGDQRASFIRENPVAKPLVGSEVVLSH